MFGLDAAILMNPKVWEASGHTAGFSDPLVECKKCHKRFRADKISPTPKSDFGVPEVRLRGGDGNEAVRQCPECGGELTEEKQFNMMFKTFIGAVEGTASQIYLRPETAQGIFVNFKNVVDSMHPKLPFGIAQIGKSFRNEITPGDFLFRVREFEQMEIEYFIKPPKNDEDWQTVFEHWRSEIHGWLESIGITAGSLSDFEVPKDDLAHYSKRTIDIFYKYPFGDDEVVGLAYRGDFDLKNHKIDYYDEEPKERFVPHAIEPSFGVDRALLAAFCEAYTEDEMSGGKRVFMKFKPEIAPIKAAVFPLLKNKPELVAKAREVYEMIKKEIQPVVFDDNGNIGKRYRRQDEIGTPYCVTVDFDTLEDNTVTLRDRDTGEQERVKIEELASRLKI